MYTQIGNGFTCSTNVEEGGGGREARCRWDAVELCGYGGRGGRWGKGGEEDLGERLGDRI
jgi:hypothetical protein